MAGPGVAADYLAFVRLLVGLLVLPRRRFGGPSESSLRARSAT